MTRRYELLIFDWDGTLMDSVARIVRCFRSALADAGVADPGEAAIRHIIGLGLAEAVEALLPREDTAARARVVEHYRERFLRLDQTEMPLYPHVREGLERLAQQGHLLAVATGKSRRGLDRVLALTDLAGLFVATRCADEALSKPHPRMLEDLLDHTATAPERALMVGDTVYDLQMARAASVAGLAVSYGVHPRELLAVHEPLACLDSFEQVCRWLEPRPTPSSAEAAGP